jgi:hypothetical protein
VGHHFRPTISASLAGRSRPTDGRQVRLISRGHLPAAHTERLATRARRSLAAAESTQN